MNIRPAQKTDVVSIQQVIAAAFSDEENAAIMNLAAELFSETSNPPITSLVAEDDHQGIGQIIGYVSFSPIILSSGSHISGYILAPLAVSTHFQKKGVGSKLITSGIEMLTRDGVDVVLVYGDPNYYGRFGFTEDIARRFLPPYPLEYPFGWLGMPLSNIEIPDIPMGFTCVPALNKHELW